MNDRAEFYQVQLKRVERLYPCNYRVLRYTVSHRQLLVLVESKAEVETNIRPIFMLFEGVEYLQIFSSWENSHFLIAPPAKKAVFLERIKSSIKNPLIFYSYFLERELIVMCSHFYISDDMPKLHEYTFDGRI